MTEETTICVQFIHNFNPMLHVTRIIFLILIISLILFIIDKASASSNWNAGTYEKRDTLVSIGMPSDIATSLIINCKTQTNPVHCIKIGASILWAESSLGTRCYKNNCVGLYDGSKWYTTTDEGLHDWTTRYAKWWYKQPNPSGFYRADGIPPATRYCMWIKRDWVCKEGTKNSWRIWNKLDSFKY